MDLTPPSTPPTPNTNPLADVFSDSPPTFPSSTPHPTDPSDIPRLRSTHATAGYRAGISASKQKFLQQGFDEGYSLGATFGLRIGYLIGLLEGVSVALRAQSIKEEGKGEAEAKRVGLLVAEMRKELSLESVFGKEWWDEGGLWKYGVQAKQEGKEVDEDDDNEVTFRDVVDDHPLVKKWTDVVEKEMETTRIRKGTFEGKEWEEGRVES